ncbi:MAG: MBOAT family O-acyltransferase [Oscillospiraceae bacterium]
MVFNSLTFLLFFAVAGPLYYAVPKKQQNLFLLLASYVFYMWAMPQYGVLVLAATGISFLSARAIEKQENPKKRKTLLTFSIALYLFILIFFKYFNFFAEVLSPASAGGADKVMSIAMPLGISFYMLQIIGYSVDVYRKSVRSERCFVDYALFVSFFPQILSGPIGRAGELLPQLKRPRSFDYSMASEGAQRFFFGLFKKVVVADGLAKITDLIYSDPKTYHGELLVIAAVFFAVRIYCDFAGYTDMAVGAAKMLGINIRENFAAPYFSTNFTLFWTRWHISLSEWLRDYIYFPLGGSRKGFLRKLLNILIVFMISGLWHGSTVNFIIWGLLQGIYRVGEELLHAAVGKPRVLNNRFVQAATNAFKMFSVFALSAFSFIFFGAKTFTNVTAFFTNVGRSVNAADIIPTLYSFACSGISTDIRFAIAFFTLLLAAVALVAVSDFCIFRQRKRGEISLNFFALLPTGARWVLYIAMSAIIVFFYLVVNTGGNSVGAFIYSGY